MFAVVDVETTGGYANSHRMTEIAIVIHDGVEVVQDYTTLLNPHRPIPAGITALTGIDDYMVADAPDFTEVAEEIRAILADHIFVAHNVNFDYSFVRAAFAEVGINYNPKRMCSVRYARKVNPGLRSYSLKNLVKNFNLSNAAAHRAWGDARVTAQLLQLLLEADKGGVWQHLVKRNSGEFNLPAHLPSDEYHNLPEKPGVYYMYNEGGEPIYIGKARNLKKRVASHFISDKESKRNQAFKREIHHIDYQLTGSELLASLLEDHEIRHYWPRYNSAQKNPKRKFGLYMYQNQKGVWQLGINRVTRQQGFIMEFYSQFDAQNWLIEMIRKYQLNPNYCGIVGLLDQQPLDQLHDSGINQLLADIEKAKQAYVFKLPGREPTEQGYILIENGHATGYGFVDDYFSGDFAEVVMDNLQELRSSVTAQSIVRKILEEHSDVLIPFEAA